MEDSRATSLLLPTICIPWDERFTFLERLFRDAIRLLAQTLSPSYFYIFGTAGEGYAVSERQFDEITRVFVDETQRVDTRPCVGVISLSTTTVIERIERASQLGATTFMITLPSWEPLSDSEVIAFFHEVLSRFPDFSFIHYNSIRSGRILDHKLYHVLGETFPNLIAAKCTTLSPQQAARCIRSAPSIQFLTGEVSYGLLRDRFVCGLVPSTVTINLQKTREFFQARGAQLHGLTREIVRLNKLFHVFYRAGVRVDGGFDKAILRLHIPEFPLRLLPPYTSPSIETFELFRSSIPPRWRHREVSRR